MDGVYLRPPTSLVQDWQDAIMDAIGTVNETGDALRKAGVALEETANDVSAFIKPGSRIDQTITTIDSSFVKMSDAAEHLDQIIGNQEDRDKLRKALTGLPDTIDILERTMTLAEENLTNMRSFTEPLGTEGRQRLEQVFSTIDKLEELMGQLAMFSQKLNNSEGSLGMILNDRELYCRINRAARNIDELTQQLKPIMADARVFSDKLARHPELLGVRGAIQRSPGIK